MRQTDAYRSDPEAWLVDCLTQTGRIPLPELLRLPHERWHLPGQMFTLTEPETEGPVQADLTLQRHPGSLMLSGHLSATLVLTCTKCLSLFEQPCELDVSEGFVFESPAAHQAISGREVEIASDDFVEELDPRGALDVADVLRQLLELSIDPSPRCDACAPEHAE
ncbi:MAG: DUF177 domain-containing protein [Vampirovibrionales bacterium]|nr:DUF177 domain-containing protein [Vampirovibrionales bacterium]